MMATATISPLRILSAIVASELGAGAIRGRTFDPFTVFFRHFTDGHVGAVWMLGPVVTATSLERRDFFAFVDHGRAPSTRLASPRARMFCAAFTSRSCIVPHSPRSHSLMRRSFEPLGPLRAPQEEQSPEVLR